MSDRDLKGGVSDILADLGRTSRPCRH